jgi:hypothetical protein
MFLQFALPHILGWDRLTNQPQLPRPIEGHPSKVDPKFVELEWDKWSHVVQESNRTFALSLSDATSSDCLSIWKNCFCGLAKPCAIILCTLYISCFCNQTLLFRFLLKFLVVNQKRKNIFLNVLLTLRFLYALVNHHPPNRKNCSNSYLWHATLGFRTLYLLSGLWRVPISGPFVGVSPGIFLLVSSFDILQRAGSSTIGGTWGCILLGFSAGVLVLLF